MNKFDLIVIGSWADGSQASGFIVSIAHLTNQDNSLEDVVTVVHRIQT